MRAFIFSDEPKANATDPVLAGVPGARRDTLIVRREKTSTGIVHRFDIRMQEDRGTVFFDG